MIIVDTEAAETYLRRATTWSGGGNDDEVSWEYAVLPALRPSGWIEVLIIGRTQQLRARLAVRWSSHVQS